MAKKSLTTQVLPFILLLGACGDKNGSLGEQPVLSGQIEGWNRGTDFTLQGVVATTSTLAPLATAPIDASGNFSITLPSAEQLAPYLIQQHGESGQPIPGCSSVNFQIDPQDFAIAILSFKAVSGTTKLSVNQSTPTHTASVFYVYVDRDLNQTGTLSCGMGASAINETVDVHFGAGWNAEILELGEGLTRVTTGPLPDGLRWTTQ